MKTPSIRKRRTRFYNWRLIYFVLQPCVFHRHRTRVLRNSRTLIEFRARGIANISHVGVRVRMTPFGANTAGCSPGSLLFADHRDESERIHDTGGCSGPLEMLRAEFRRRRRQQTVPKSHGRRSFVRVRGRHVDRPSHRFVSDGAMLANVSLAYYHLAKRSKQPLRTHYTIAS